jgi:hypothetical protein
MIRAWQADRHEWKRTSAPATSRKMSASSPIEKPMVATNSPMATNETGGLARLEPGQLHSVP